MKKSLLPGLALLFGLVASASFAADKPEEVKKARPADDFLVLPLRIYRLKAEDVPEVHCHQLSDADIRVPVGVFLAELLDKVDSHVRGEEEDVLIALHLVEDGVDDLAPHAWPPN